MKIVSWNVNGIRAVAKKWFLDFFQKVDADVFCIQEPKAFEGQVWEDLKKPFWYDFTWHAWTRPWYAWTVNYFRIPALDKKNHFWEIEHFHEDWRIVETKFENFTVINWYFPNWWTRADWTEMLTYKLEFYDKLIDYCNKLVEKWESLIITWDFNICHQEIDIARPKENKNSIWFLPEERAKFTELLENDYIDVFRYFYPDKKDIYSWWSYRAWARQRNVWWRIDYFVVNTLFIEKVKNIQYLNNVIWSDHCPIMLNLEE